MMYSHLLFSTIWIPFICGLFFLFLVKDVKTLGGRLLGIAGAFLPFIFAWVLYFNYDSKPVSYTHLTLPTNIRE